jgi:hypothetical protein
VVQRPLPPFSLAATLSGTRGVMSIERLTADDLLMLWPDDTWPQDIGAPTCPARPSVGLTSAGNEWRAVFIQTVAPLDTDTFVAMTP